MLPWAGSPHWATPDEPANAVGNERKPAQTHALQAAAHRKPSVALAGQAN